MAVFRRLVLRTARNPDCHPGRPEGPIRDPCLRVRGKMVPGSRASRSAGMTIPKSLLFRRLVLAAACGKSGPKIVPILVVLFDQFDLPFPAPALQPLLSGDGFANLIMDFEIHEMMNAVFRGKAADHVIAML